MTRKVMALNTKGQLTHCSVSPDMRGIGRCNHVSHQNDNESNEQFIHRVNKKGEGKEDTKTNIEYISDELKAFTDKNYAGVRDIKDIARDIKEDLNNVTIIKSENYILEYIKKEKSLTMRSSTGLTIDIDYMKENDSSDTFQAIHQQISLRTPKIKKGIEGLMAEASNKQTD